MLTIQQVGQEILTNSPKNFYIFCGIEYGIKCKYIDILTKYYGDKIECESVQQILDSMKKKQLVPKKPAVYVVRYDADFVSKLSDKTAKEISSTNILGTIICIYQEAKHQSKCEKYLPDYTVSIDSVSKEYLQKYLINDFKDLNRTYVGYVSTLCSDYGQGRLMCEQLNSISRDDLSLQDVAFLSGVNANFSEDSFKEAVAAKNFSLASQMIDKIDTMDSAVYAILSLMIEFDKIFDSKYSNSAYKKYIQSWTREDIYYMFMHSFSVLEIFRSNYAVNNKDILLTLLALLRYNRIPSEEVISWT